MELTEIKKLRREQLIVTNGILFLGLVSYSLFIYIFAVPVSLIYLLLGILLLFVAVAGLLKGNSTRSWIPIFERVAEYEKQKMGSEWRKQRKISRFIQLFLSGFMFFQGYSNWNELYTFQIDFSLFVMLFILTFATLNLGLLLHVRRVDRATAVTDLEGYSWKSTIKGFVLGVVIAIVFLVVIMFFVLQGI